MTDYLSVPGTGLSARMKEYEEVARARLIRRLPVIGRLDGKAFHTLTRGLEKPYDARFQACMLAAAKTLCTEAQGVRLAYVFSDEVSVLLSDWAELGTEAWFDYGVPKLLSVSAGICALAFDAAYREAFGGPPRTPPVFDARFFNLPPGEVCNYFIWRQQDATRNSINGLGQRYFPHQQLQDKGTNEVQEMLFQVHGVNWNDRPTAEKRGVCVRRQVKTASLRESMAAMEPERLAKLQVAVAAGKARVDLDAPVERAMWEVDAEVPIFTQDRAYIELLLGGDDE